MFQSFLHTFLVHFVNLFGAVRLASAEMDAEMSVEIIVADRTCSMGHPVHGCRIYMSVVFDQDGAAFPAPVPVDGLHRFGIGRGKRLGVNMVRSAPALYRKDFSGFDVLHLESRALRDCL